MSLAALLLQFALLIGLLMRPQGRVLRVTSWVSIGLVAAYLIDAALLYLSEGAMARMKAPRLAAAQAAAAATRR